MSAESPARRPTMALPTAADRRLGRRGEQKTEALSGFSLMMNGQIESGEFLGADNLFCRYTFAYGPDWRMTHGESQAYSQVVQKGSSSDGSIVWNLPLEAFWKSTNPQGWPRLVLSVYSQDIFGRYVPAGYGSVAVPTIPGKYVRHVRMFSPVSSSLLQGIIGWITGHAPEFYDSKFVAANEGREVTRVRATGRVKVAINVMTRGMAAHGYTTGAPPDLLDTADTHTDGGGAAGAVLPLNIRPGLAAGATEAGDRTRGADIVAATRKLLSSSASLVDPKGRLTPTGSSLTSTPTSTVASTRGAGGDDAATGLSSTVTGAVTRNTVVGPLTSTTSGVGTLTSASSSALPPADADAAAMRKTRRRLAERQAEQQAAGGQAGQVTEVTAVKTGEDGEKPARVRSRSKHGRSGTLMSMFPVDEQSTLPAPASAGATATPPRRNVPAEMTVADEGDTIAVPRRPASKPSPASAAPGTSDVATRIRAVDAVEPGGAATEGDVFVRRAARRPPRTEDTSPESKHREP